MQTATQSEGLVVWTERNSLDEAKSLFAPYSPRFQTFPCNVKTALGRIHVSVLSCLVPNRMLRLRAHWPLLELQGIESAGLYAAPYRRFRISRGNDGGAAEVCRCRMGFQLATPQTTIEGTQHPGPCSAQGKRKNVFRAPERLAKTRSESGTVGQCTERDCPDRADLGGRQGDQPNEQEDARSSRIVHSHERLCGRSRGEASAQYAA